MHRKLFLISKTFSLWHLYNSFDIMEEKFSSNAYKNKETIPIQVVPLVETLSDEQLQTIKFLKQ